MANEKLRESLWGKKHWMVEVSPSKWKTKSRHIIESVINRTLKDREKVFYLDKDTTNCQLSNLYVVDFDKKIKFSILENHTLVVQSMKAWSKDNDRCIQCQDDSLPHHGLGLCEKCYFVDYWKPKKSINKLHGI